MAAAAAWRARLLQRVVGAHEHVRDVHERLVTLEAFFRLDVAALRTEPGPEDWMASLRLKLNLTMGSLRSATHSLNSALVNMEAAEILALHAGNVVNPWELLPSIHHLGQHDAAVQDAMARLQASQQKMLNASRIVEWTRGHLSMAIAVLDPAVPNSMALSSQENHSAYAALLAAIRGTHAALAEATVARQILSP